MKKKFLPDFDEFIKEQYGEVTELTGSVNLPKGFKYDDNVIILIPSELGPENTSGKIIGSAPEGKIEVVVNGKSDMFAATDLKVENEELNEAKKKIKPYKKVKVGDMGMENPDAGGEWNNELGKVLWKGTYKELKKSKYKDLDSDWEFDSPEEFDDYDLIVIDLKGWDGGPTLFNYDNDPSGTVVFESIDEDDNIDESKRTRAPERGFSKEEILDFLKKHKEIMISGDDLDGDKRQWIRKVKDLNPDGTFISYDKAGKPHKNEYVAIDWIQEGFHEIVEGKGFTRFDRHSEMDASTLKEIQSIINDFFDVEDKDNFASLENALYGLYDGFDYSENDWHKKDMKKLKSIDSKLHKRIEDVYKKVSKYKTMDENIDE